MKILITGNRGFIGSHLQQKLEKEGNTVIGLDNLFHASQNPVEGSSIIGDVRNKEVVDDLVKNVDMVYHLAAIIHVDYSIEHPEETMEVNVIGTLNVLEACRKYQKKLVFASTSEVYGSSQAHFIHETHPLDCQSPYAASKVAGDRLCYAYMQTYGMNICILRNFNTFGEFQNDGSYGGVIAIFTRQALKDEPITIYGSGEQQRDYMHITDALKGYEIAKDVHGVMNVGTGTTVTVNQIADWIKEIAGSSSEIVHVSPRPGEVQRLCAGTLVAESFGFIPDTDFKKHLREYIEWYTKHIQITK